MMTLDDANKVANIVGTADNGCSVCIAKLVQQLNIDFAYFTWTIGARVPGHFIGDENGETYVDSFYRVEVKPL